HHPKTAAGHGRIALLLGALDFGGITVWLSSPAPVAAQRHELYRASDEIGQTFTLAGYGSLGSTPGSPIRSWASNQFDAEAGALKERLGTGMAWTPATDTILLADYDNGTAAQDALGRLLNVSGLGLGATEGLNMPGDSGGPAFIGNKVAGIASYTASLSTQSIQPDIDTVSNSSFGELGFWQRVSHYQQWIDQSLRAEYQDAPTKPEEVKKEVTEGQSGSTYAYFLLTFTGVRTDANLILSVDYTTRDGTAIAGQDYLAVSGTLKLYPGENQAVIPVEILGDTQSEGNETFYLDVTNPVGGSFGEGVVTLTAVRTILNDDGVLA
ncbi:MAG: Calx-beta domain-containing protein, partial [Flavobacteriales bacterium]